MLKDLMNEFIFLSMTIALQVYSVSQQSSSTLNMVKQENKYAPFPWWNADVVVDNYPVESSKS